MSKLLSSNPCGGCKDRPIEDGACFSIASLYLDQHNENIRVWVKPGLYVELQGENGRCILELENAEEVDSLITILQAAKEAAYNRK